MHLLRLAIAVSWEGDEQLWLVHIYAAMDAWEHAVHSALLALVFTCICIT